MSQLPPHLELVHKEVPRFFVRRALNPASSKQILGFIKASGQQPGRNPKSKAESADADTLERLARKTGSPFYKKLLERRNKEKLLGTYVGTWDPEKERWGTGLLAELTQEGRIHSSFGHNPSTLRLSSASPNLQNLAGDEDDPWAVRFRECLVAAPGCKLIYADFDAIEAVETGWCSRDPDYIRLATLGVHDYVNSHYLKQLGLIAEAASLEWASEDLSRCFSDLRARFPSHRKKVKRVVHGRNYLLSALGLYLRYPEDFPSVKAAEEIIAIYDQCAPRLAPWQDETSNRAHEQHYLGGPGTYPVGHPFSYRHWFWHIRAYTKLRAEQARKMEREGKPIAWIKGKPYAISWGEDRKRAVSFFPQSIAAGVIAEAILRLFTLGSSYYIGDAFYGQTPLRAQVHDALLLEVPDAQVERVLRALGLGMACPIREQPCPPEWGIGPHLRIGVSVKVGRNWSEGGMEKIRLEVTA